MERQAFIQVLKEQVEVLQAERTAIKKQAKALFAANKLDESWEIDCKATKLSHEISAIENAIREMERK